MSPASTLFISHIEPCGSHLFHSEQGVAWILFWNVVAQNCYDGPYIHVMLLLSSSLLLSYNMLVWLSSLCQVSSWCGVFWWMCSVNSGVFCCVLFWWMLFWCQLGFVDSAVGICCPYWFFFFFLYSERIWKCWCSCVYPWSCHSWLHVS